MPHAPSTPPTFRWSWPIARLAGTEVRVHGTFLMLMAWVVASPVVAGHGLRAAAGGLLFVLTLFAVVVLHELGHVVVARRYGIGTRDITLLPIGGVASVDRLPTDPRQEVLVAVAGPAVNLLLAMLALGAMWVVGIVPSARPVEALSGPLLTKFFWLNVTLGAFNLLPAFPLDGGRVLRAVLATRMGRVRATDRAARLGKWMAIALGVLGVWGSPTLVLVALFVWMGAHAEAGLVHMNAALAHVRVGDAMVTVFETLPAQTSIALGADRATHTTQRDFPVLDGDRLIGFVSATELLTTACQPSAGGPVATITHPFTADARRDEPMADVLARLGRAGDQPLPVMDGGRLVGLLLPRNVRDAARLRERDLVATS